LVINQESLHDAGQQNVKVAELYAYDSIDFWLSFGVNHRIQQETRYRFL